MFTWARKQRLVGAVIIPYHNKMVDEEDRKSSQTFGWFPSVAQAVIYQKLDLDLRQFTNHVREKKNWGLLTCTSRICRDQEGAETVRATPYLVSTIKLFLSLCQLNCARFFLTPWYLTIQLEWIVLVEWQTTIIAEGVGALLKVFGWGCMVR